jgi:hypothetical protein
MEVKNCSNCKKIFYMHELIKSCKCNIYCCRRCQDDLFEPTFIKLNKEIYIKKNNEFVKSETELFQRSIQNKVYCSQCETDLKYTN